MARIFPALFSKGILRSTKLSKMFVRNNPSKAAAYVSAIVVVIAGSVLILSHAATQSVATEGESGALSSSVTTVNDTSASGGMAIKFGHATLPNPTMTLTVDGAIKSQTVDGFGTSINVHSWNNGELKPALDMLVDQNGSSIFRVVQEMTDWESTNDNSDPTTFNWTAYNAIYGSTKFTDLWNTIAYLRQKGVPANQIMISYMGDGPNWMGGANLNSASEDEWVEEVASSVYYGINTAGAQFTMLSPNNEMDIQANEGITMGAAQYARVLNKLAIKLNAVGLGSLRIVAPETADPCKAASYFTQMAAFPTLMAKVDHASTHGYGGNTCNLETTLKNSAYPNVNVWMTEYCSDPTPAFQFLDEGAALAMVWDGYDSIYQHAIVNGHPNIPGNDGCWDDSMIAYNATTGLYSPRKIMYENGQLYKYVTPGMQLVDSSVSNGNFVVHSFVHPATGAITIVGSNTGATNEVIGGTLKNTPAASIFHVTLTNSSLNMAVKPNVTISGNKFTVSVPANSLFTLTTL
jgi:O-glycosyl hydrolase